jgi:hypothetical protein
VRIETEGGTRRLVFAVRRITGHGAAVVKLIVGVSERCRPYLRIGAPGDDSCIGSIEGPELRRLAQAILRETRSMPARRRGP